MGAYTRRDGSDAVQDAVVAHQEVVAETLEQGDGYISYDEYKDALYQLLQEVQKEEIGADLALEYSDRFLARDEGILFLKWALDHVGSSRRKGDLQRVLNQKLRPRVRMYIGSGVMANKPCKMDFSFWNCERTTLTIRKYVGRKMTKDGPDEILLTGDVGMSQVGSAFGGSITQFSTGGSATAALAIARSWRSPCERFPPSASRTVS